MSFNLNSQSTGINIHIGGATLVLNN